MRQGKYLSSVDIVNRRVQFQLSSILYEKSYKTRHRRRESFSLALGFQSCGELSLQSFFVSDIKEILILFCKLHCLIVRDESENSFDRVIKNQKKINEFEL